MTVATPPLSILVGQLLMPSIPGQQFNPNIELLFREVYPGSVILYGSNIESPRQLHALCHALHQRANVPFTIAIDQEGGRVTRLCPEPFTRFPSARSIAQTQDLSIAAKCAQAIGKEMKDCAITLNLAPVCDMNTHPLNPVIGVRSFGETPEVVIPFAQATIQGLHNAQVLTCIKHFPGHGETTVDSHYGLPCIKKPAEAIEKVEFAPFMELACQTDAVMTAHVMMPSLDKSACATFSRAILQRLRAHFNGVIISDSITMEGALAQTEGNLVEAAIRALDAGCDLICIGGSAVPVEQMIMVHHGIVNAIKTGRLDLQTIQASVQRIQTMKQRFPSPLLQAAHPLRSNGYPEHRALVQEIAERSIHIIKKHLSSSLANKKICVFYSKAIQEVVQQSPTLRTLNISSEGLLESETEESLLKRSKEAELNLCIIYNACINPQAQALLNIMAAHWVPTIVISTGNPHDSAAISSWENVELIINTYSPTTVAIDAALRRITTLGAENT